MRFKMWGKYLCNRWRRLWELLRFAVVKPDYELTFWVVSAQYNAGEAILRCLDSVYNQSLPRSRVRHIFIDDASTDGTPELIAGWLREHPDNNVEYIRNAENKNMAHNLHTAFKRAPAGSIAMQLDGDDWLHDSEALEFLSRVYASRDIWATYNTWQSSDGRCLGQTRRYTSQVCAGNTFRTAPWNAGHLKTFRSELYRQVPDAYMRDQRTGYWWNSSADQAFFLCILELAGSHIYATQRLMYTYYIREHTTLCSYSAEQEDCRREIRKLEPLKQLESYC